MDVIQRWKVVGALHNPNGIRLYAKVPYGSSSVMIDCVNPLFSDKLRGVIGTVHIIVTGVFGFHGLPNVEVGFSLTIPNRQKREYGIRLILAPKSARAFFTAKGPIIHGSVKLPGSPSFWGKLLWMTAEHSSLSLTEEAAFSSFSLCERDEEKSLIVVILFLLLYSGWERKEGSRVLILDLVVIAKVGASDLGNLLSLIVERIWENFLSISLRCWSSISSIPFVWNLFSSMKLASSTSEGRDHRKCLPQTSILARLEICYRERFIPEAILYPMMGHLFDQVLETDRGAFNGFIDPLFESKDHVSKGRDILSHSHAPNIIFSLPDDRDFHCCDSGWRNVLFCHLTIEFFLFRVSTQALIPLVGSFY
ncbi:hypothetical protein Tco_0018273 [Tanacetum coccineum]